LEKDGAKGLINGATETFKTGAPELPGDPPLPPGPQTGHMGPDGQIKGRMQRLKDAAMDSSAGKFVGKKLAQNSGVAVTDSKGKVYYDPNKDESTWAGKMTAEDKKFRANLPGGENYSPDIEGAVAGGVVPVKIVDGLDSDPKIQGAAENSQDQTEALAESVSDQTEATTEDTKVTKETIKQDKAQKRQARAGKALGALGTATMVCWDGYTGRGKGWRDCSAGCRTYGSFEWDSSTANGIARPNCGIGCRYWFGSWSMDAIQQNFREGKERGV